MERATPVKVQMFGSFTLSANGVSVGDGDNRSKKVWLFLAYLIYRKGRAVEAQSYIDLLWDKDEAGSNPTNALKTILHRSRATLDQLWPGAGHQLILRQGSTYLWNTDYPVKLDVDEFDKLCAKAEQEENEEKRLKHYMNALALYQGDFLNRFSAHMWVMPIATHYHQLYLQTVFQVLPLLQELGRYSEMEAVCRGALAQDPYTEDLYYYLMTALVSQGKQQEVTVVYESMAQLLMDNFGVMPSDKIRELYREALSSLNDRSLSAEAVLDQLREPDGARGALVCQYDIFRSIYRSVARSLLRSGDVVHVAIFSVHHRERSEHLPRRSLDRVMDNLQDVIRTSLRRGDVAARCSPSQFVIMLPQANFENSQMVSQRILRAFNRQYPHTPAAVQVSVHPVEPN